MRLSRMLAMMMVAAALAALALTPAFTAATKAGTVSITLTDKGITVQPGIIAAGDYTVIVKNMTSTPRGIEMTGRDRAGSVYVRYSEILRKGKTEKFKWYFPKEDTAYVRDLLKCEHAQNSCVIASFGRMTKAIRSN